MKNSRLRPKSEPSQDSRFRTEVKLFDTHVIKPFLTILGVICSIPGSQRKCDIHSFSVQAFAVIY